jgi:hypothetical protein
LGVGPPAAWRRCNSREPGVVEGLGAIRFGGVPFGAICAGTFPLGDCLGTGEPVVVGFPPGFGGTPGVTEGFAAGEALPGTFVPSRLGGADLLPTAAFGEAPGVTFAFGERTLRFNKLEGVFCPATTAGEPGAPGGPVICPLLPICGFTKGVGVGRFFGGGFCSAMVFLSFCAS